VKANCSLLWMTRTPSKALDSAKADYAASKAAIADLEVQLKNARIQFRRAEQLQNAGVQTQEQLDNGAHSF